MRAFARNGVALAATTFLILTATAASAQPEASGPNATTSASSPQPVSKAEQKKQAKAQRKAERKAARAKNNAELKQLQSHGYNPSANDLNYPENLQNAQKKANSPSGASQ